jgi:hypothetical protein
MLHRIALVAVILSAVALVGSSRADDKGKNPAFERLKKLAGEWSGKSDHEGSSTEMKVTYKVTAAGSAVMETLFPGTDHEMVTMYTLDGDKLILTHYCAMGNQPRLKAEKTDDPKKLVFKFVDGTNLNPAKDGHMHEGQIEWVDDDHIVTQWTGYNEGKPVHTAKFDLRRQKAK